MRTSAGLHGCSAMLVAALFHRVEGLPRGASLAADDGDGDGADEGLCAALSFDDSLWLIVITITTVGYGDVRPCTLAGRAIVAATLVLTLVLIPHSTNAVLELLALSKYARASYVPSTRGARRGDPAAFGRGVRATQPHVLVVGKLDNNGLAIKSKRSSARSNRRWAA